MGTRNKLALLAAATIFIASCQYASVDTVNSNNVQSSTVYQDYRIEADRSQTQVAATFRVGGSTGTTIEMSEPGKILHNGNDLSLSAPANLLGTNYKTKGTDYRAGLKGYQPNHEFVFTDKSGATYKNSLSLAPLEIAAGKSDLVLRRAQPTMIRLSRAIAQNETLSVGINTTAGDEVPTRGNSVYLSASRDALVITPQYWQGKIPAGRAELQVKVSRRENVSQGTTVGGAIQIVYSSAPVAVVTEKPEAGAKETTTNANAANTNAANANAAGANTAGANLSVPQKDAPLSNARNGSDSADSKRAVSRKSARRKIKSP